MLKPYPATLPDCPASWQEKERDNRIQSEVDVGIPKRRRRYTRPLLDVTVGWTRKTDVYEAFRDFYRIDLRDGIDSFEFPHPITGQMLEFAFTSPPTIQMVQNNVFQIVCAWEQQP